MSKLIITIDGNKDEEVQILQGTMTIGRNKDNDVRLNDSAVSSTHAKVVTFFEPTFVQDMNSTNGTYINNKRVLKHTLRDGDVVTVGKYQLIYQYSNDDTIGHSANNTLVLEPEEIELLLKHASGPDIKRLATNNLIPEDVQWVAQDQEGMWWGFSSNPKQNDQGGWTSNPADSKHELLQSGANPEWQKTLRKL